jgi:hypothetical protein
MNARSAAFTVKPWPTGAAATGSVADGPVPAASTTAMPAAIMRLPRVKMSRALRRCLVGGVPRIPLVRVKPLLPFFVKLAHDAPISTG